MKRWADALRSLDEHAAAGTAWSRAIVITAWSTLGFEAGDVLNIGGLEQTMRLVPVVKVERGTLYAWPWWEARGMAR